MSVCPSIFQSVLPECKAVRNVNYCTLKIDRQLNKNLNIIYILILQGGVSATTVKCYIVFTVGVPCAFYGRKLQL